METRNGLLCIWKLSMCLLGTPAIPQSACLVFFVRSTTFFRTVFVKSDVARLALSFLKNLSIVFNCIQFCRKSFSDFVEASSQSSRKPFNGRREKHTLTHTVRRWRRSASVSSSAPSCSSLRSASTSAYKHGELENSEHYCDSM